MSLSCQYCGKLFKKPSHRTIHERTHTGEKPFKCEFESCDASFARKENLVRHFKSHVGARDFQCSECGNAFGSRDHLRRHILTHQTVKLFTCEICSEEFPKKTELRDHKLQIHEIAEFQCEICQKHYPCQSKLLLHLNSHQKLKPSDSSTSSPSSSAGVLHRDAVVLSLQQFQQHDEERYHLQPVDQSPELSSLLILPTASVPSFDDHYSAPQTRGQLVQYILEQELNNQRRYNNIGDNSNSFAIPTRTMTSSYPCDICFEIFRKKTLLRTHKLALHGIAEFRCDRCQKIFNRKSKLESHVANDGCSHRGHFECPKQHCHVVFPSKEFLERHLQSCHSHPTSPPKDLTSSPSIGHKRLPLVEKYLFNSVGLDSSVPSSPAPGDVTESDFDSVNEENNNYELDEMIMNQMICFECSPSASPMVAHRSTELECEEDFPSDRPLKKRRYSPYRYSELLENSVLPTGSSLLHPLTPSLSKTTSSNKKQTFLCPIDYCQKSFHYRSVRDRHVENVHGFIGSGSQTKKPSPTALGEDEGVPPQSHLDQEISGSEMNSEKFLWNELLGVAV